MELVRRDLLTKQVMKKMILFALMLMVLNSYAATGVTIENVYIDTLIQRYLSIEKYLWDYIYLNGSARSDSVQEINKKIRSNHDEIMNDSYLEYIRELAFLVKFGKYVNFDDVKELQQISLTQPNAYMTTYSTFEVYNYTRTNLLFEQIEKDSKKVVCKWSTQIESPNQNLFMFYEVLSANLLTSYMKSQRFNMLRVVRNGFEEHDHEKLRTKFSTMYNETIKAAKEYLQRANRLIWMCDKNATNDNGTSMEVTNFLRGYVDNEINLNNDASCWGSCSDYKFARNYGCFDGTFCNETMRSRMRFGEENVKCSGTIVECDYIDRKMEICPSIRNNRRYEFINYRCTFRERVHQIDCNPDGRYFGRNLNCESTLTTLESFINFPTRCDYCFCYCDEKNIDSDRYFSLQPVVSDLRKNMIVSGVSVIKRNGIFSWTISQARLLNNGRVQQYTYNTSQYVFQDFKRTDPGIVDGVDYHTLSWQNRSVNLDIIVLPPGCVVTGVRFVVNKQYLSLQIRSTKFDFNTGILLDEHEWVSNLGNGERINLQLDRPEPSRYYDMYGAYMSSIPDFGPNKFIKFRPSDPDKDAGQTTVPFIDSQVVRPKYLTPLSGVGIYYKGKPGLGGFIAPTIVVYDMSSYVGNR